MKGISTILAMILIVIIVVALIGLTYTFAVGLFQTTTTATTTATASVTTNIQKSVYIPYNGASCKSKDVNNLWVNFTIQNSGTLTIIPGELGAIFDGADISLLAINASGANNITTMSLVPGKIATLGATIPKVTGRTTRTLTVSAPAGDVSYTFTGTSACET